ncbi:PQQ-dependent sugar dehydrogenase [Meridianimarinicoccus sp. RP-17]|uniref:PQQ-dependent sugar dehydrogenase n=1 Tax=Meridianimarinicoccus zhengii TaxID=2056810 RepID=UPI001F24C508|nr:PQQ-dependent sugar dehydrogenase [Phycocomes zhengii]
MNTSLYRPATLSLAALLAAALAMPAAAQSGMNTTALQHSVVLDGLENPWDMAFLDDGTMFFTEKCRGLSVRMPSGEVNALLGMTGVDGYASQADDLFCEG